MAKASLEKELHGGSSQFDVFGKAQIKDGTFPEEVATSKSGWQYKRVSFPVSVGENNLTYVQMMGGHSTDNPVVYVQNKENEAFRVKWDLRNNEEVLKNVAGRSFIHVLLEKDESGKLIDKRFISELDAIDYIAKHLNDGDDVHISGNVEYQRYNGNVQRSLNITYIVRLDKEYEPKAEIKQTYLVDHNTVPRNYEKSLEQNGKVVLSTFVPQYVGKENGKEIRKTLAMPQELTFSLNGKGVDYGKKVLGHFFEPDKKVVREITLVNKLVYGIEESKGQVELTPELQELIDLGIMTEEEIKNEVTTNGKRVDEVVFIKVAIGNQEDNRKIMMEDRYAPEALIIPEDDDDVEEDTTFTDDSNTEDSAEDVFADDDLFA